MLAVSTTGTGVQTPRITRVRGTVRGLGFFDWGICGRLRAPLGSPLGCFPPVHDVDPLVSDLLASEVHEVDGELPRAAVIADQVLSHDKIAPAGELTNVKLQVGGIDGPPLLEVLHSLETLTRLWKLEHRVRVIDLLLDLRVLPAAAGPMSLQRFEKASIDLGQIVLVHGHHPRNGCQKWSANFCSEPM